MGYIKREIEKLQGYIKDAQEEIAAYRKMCTHTKTHEGLWSWREGSTVPATICSECGTCIEIDMGGALGVITTNDKL